LPVIRARPPALPPDRPPADRPARSLDRPLDPPPDRPPDLRADPPPGRSACVVIAPSCQPAPTSAVIKE